MRTVVITGVSRGLGAALFDGLAGRGDRVVALGRRFTDAQYALAKAGSGRITLVEADLTTAGPPDLGELGPEAMLVHNAGVVEPIGAVGALPPDRIAATVAVNLTAPMLLTNAFLAAVPERATDVRVLFISSGAATRVIDGWGVYCATKAGGEMFFAALAAQLRGDPRYTVESVNPGVMDTDMQGVIRAAGGHFPDRERFRGLHSRGELPSPESVAQKIIAEHLTAR